MATPVSCNVAEQKFLYAVSFNPKCAHEGALGKVHAFGDEWIVKRENFGSAFIGGITGAIHSFVSALFHSIWSMTAGKCFVDKEPRELAGRCWKEVGVHLLVIIKSIAGIVCPAFAKWVDDRFLPTIPKNEVEKECCKKEKVSIKGSEDVKDVSDKTPLIDSEQTLH